MSETLNHLTAPEPGLAAVVDADEPVIATGAPRPGARTWDWAKRIASVGLAQTAIQGIGFVSGIFVVRTLPTHEYAFYTVAYSMLGTMNVLADAGISAGMLAEGGRAWDDPMHLGKVLATGLALRRRFAAWSLGICVPTLVILLRQHGAAWTTVAGMVAAIVLAFWFLIATSLYSIASQLHQRLLHLQGVTITQNLTRLGGLVTVLLVWPTATAAVAVTAVAQAWGAMRLKRVSAERCDEAQPEDPVTRREIMRVVRRMLPSSIYYCVSSQVAIWLIAVFGSTMAVAQVGALGRLGQALAVIGGFSSVVLVPRFARLPENWSLVIRRYFQILGAVAIVGTGAVALAAIFPTSVMQILGRNYHGLAEELVLQIAGSVLVAIAGTAYALGSARKCVISPVLSIPMELVWQVMWLFLLDLSTVRGVLTYTILVGLLGIVLHVGNFLWWSARMRKTPV